MRAIEEQASGRFQVRFRYGTSPTTGKPKSTSEMFGTRKQAEQFARWLEALGPQAALDQLYSAEQVEAVPSMDTLAADHIRFLTGIEPGTRMRYERRWADKWSPLIGGIPADQLTADDIRAAINVLSGFCAEKSLKNHRGLLAGVCSRAVEQGYQRTVLTKGIRLPRGTAGGGGESEDMVLLTQDEWPLLHAAFAPHWQPMVRFLVGTGARWGEVVAIRVGDVNLAAGTVRLTRALKDSPDGNRRIGVTKTKRSRRTLALPPEVLEDLGPLVSGHGPNQLVFTAPRGGMVAHRTFWSDHWRPALWRAQHCAEHRPDGCRCGTAHPKRCTVHDVPPPPCGCADTLRSSPRIHDLRHTHASWLLGLGIPIHVVQARLGHESIQTTVDTYSHLLPDAQAAAATAASLAFRPTAIG